MIVTEEYIIPPVLTRGVEIDRCILKDSLASKTLSSMIVKLTQACISPANITKSVLAGTT